MKLIPLSGRYGRGLFAQIDDEDFELFSQVSWALNNFGYAIHHTTVRNGGSPKGKTLLMQRSVMKAPKGVNVDHINGDRLDNRRVNLRFCTQSQNRMNSGKFESRASRFKGVRQQQRGKPWYARIKSKPGDAQKEKFIGAFESEIHAAVAYDLWATVIFGEFARTNFPVVGR